MKPHQERVLNEKAELDAKLEKLKAFIGGDVFNALPIDERMRLNRQRNVMEDYSRILWERIEAFGKAATRYVAGFMFDPQRTQVALIRKNKPAWQKGLLNGIGGKIEGVESPEQAMVREFKEEAGWEDADQSFRHFAQIHGPDWSVDFFYTVGDLSKLRTMETEPIVRVNLAEIHVLRADMIENLPWLISLAIDQWDDARPVFANVRYP